MFIWDMTLYFTCMYIVSYTGNHKKKKLTSLNRLAKNYLLTKLIKYI